MNASGVIGLAIGFILAGVVILLQDWIKGKCE